jgi:two-component system, chemotaxis family, chemotaxis protein CheY
MGEARAVIPGSRGESKVTPMSKNVIIVDDSAVLIKQLRTFFEGQMGFTVLATGSDGGQACDLYRKHRPDLITLDITMPNKDGMEALAEILAEFPGANIMMISAIRGPTMTRCLKLGAKAYMEKPLRFNDAQFVEDFKASLQEVFGQADSG